MNKKSNQIEGELNQTTKRLDELTEMRDGITVNLQGLQQGFIDGKTSLDELQAEQGKLITLDSSIKVLEAKQDELHTAFQKASLSEARQTLLKKAKETAIEAESFHNEYLKMRNDFHDSIRDYTEKLIGKLKSYRGKQKEFGRIADQTQLTFKELEQLGLSPESHKIATSSYINYQPFEYGEVVALAENLLAGKLNKAAQAKDKAEFDETRAANQEKIKAQIEAENNKPKPFAVTYNQQ
jgi:uncharacterized coiled-coil DUF342 family protein